MTIESIYAQYQIMPQLSLHMRRVASVGQLILNGWQGDLNRDLVMRTLLLHDMGNLVKFDLSEAGQQKLRSADPAELPLWREVQLKFWDTYGRDTHTATQKILNGLGQHDAAKVLEEEHAAYSGPNPMSILDQSFAAQILLYCDMRVTPQGVVTLHERASDLAHRYSRPIEEFSYLNAVEERIQQCTTTGLATITEASVQPFLDKLLTYTI
jgi:hypothetical protein